MNGDFLVQLQDGRLVLKAAANLHPDDKLVFDGPDATESLRKAQADLEAEIKAAGGLDAWKARHR